MQKIPFHQVSPSIPRKRPFLLWRSVVVQCIKRVEWFGTAFVLAFNFSCLKAGVSCGKPFKSEYHPLCYALSWYAMQHMETALSAPMHLYAAGLQAKEKPAACYLFPAWGTAFQERKFGLCVPFPYPLSKCSSKWSWVSWVFISYSFEV